MEGSGIVRKSENKIRALSSTTLKIETFDGELQFTATCQYGWAAPVATCGLIGAAITYGFLAQRDSYFVVAAVAAVAALINWIKGPVTILRVSEARILATGNLHRWSDSNFELPASEVASIGWSFGSRNRGEGLYVRHGIIVNTCVLPGLSENQARQVTDAITVRFPHYKIESVSKSLFELAGNG